MTSNDEPTTEAPPVALDLETIYAIESSYHRRDADNRDVVETSIDTEEGYFRSREAADTRTGQLNEKLADHHEVDEKRRQREHTQKVREAQKFNKEAAAIRAAGLKKADVPEPKAYVPRTFEAFIATTNHTMYAVTEINRSDYDLRENTAWTEKS